MKKTFTLSEVDCPACAERMAAAIRRLPGINDAAINFITQKLTLETNDAAGEETIAAVRKTVARMQRGCSLL